MSRRLESFAWLALLSSVFVSWHTPSALAQQPAASLDVTIHASTSLVLVDVIALHGQTQRSDTTLTREDFEVWDNGKPMLVKTFDTGSATRPLVLWFVVQCAMSHWEKEGSALFRDQIDRLKPALDTLNPADSVAVAHWCDDGQARLDLQPTRNLDAAVASVEQVLAPAIDPPSHDRLGELALQKTLQLIVDSTRSLPHDTVPVLVFLYGDYSAMPRREADEFIDKLLGSSAIAFGLRDARSPRIHSFGEQGAIANYFATQTGGQYFTADPESYASCLAEIVAQMHSRYELGFRPKVLDGTRHSLRVSLTKKAVKAHHGIRLRHRVAYIPVPATAG